MIDQPEALSSVVKRTEKWTQLSSDRAFCDNEVGSGINNGSPWKGIFYSPGKLPAREVDPDSHLVEELNPFAILPGASRVVVNLVEDDHAVWCIRAGITRTQGGKQQRTEP